MPQIQEENETEQEACPLDCPNRRSNGITLIFKSRRVQLDPFEMILWLLLLTIPVGTTIRDAWNSKLNFEEGLKRIGAIAAIGFAIRNSPTDKAYEYLFGMRMTQTKNPEKSDKEND